MNIYERVTLPKDQFTKYGDVSFLKHWDMSGTAGGGYRVITAYQRLKPNNPTLTRYSASVIRERDNKVLGKSVYYSRIGGDILPRLGPDSARSCPPRTSEIGLIRSIFLQGDKE
jgi:hypothetical protein